MYYVNYACCFGKQLWSLANITKSKLFVCKFMAVWAYYVAMNKIITKLFDAYFKGNLVVLTKITSLAVNRLFTQLMWVERNHLWAFNYYKYVLYVSLWVGLEKGPIHVQSYWKYSGLNCWYPRMLTNQD
jgi:hypothetical protein